MKKKEQKQEQSVPRGACWTLGTELSKRARYAGYAVVGHATRLRLSALNAASLRRAGGQPKELTALSVLVVIIVITMSDEDGNGHNDATANNNKS